MTASKSSKETADGWAFRTRFRRAAFGWRGSRLAIQRIEEALAEIRAAGRHDPIVAAEGAVLLLEKLSPALSQVDSSSGALGSATHAAVKTLVPIIAGAPVSDAVRARWLERMFAALQDDDPPYIEALGDHWGDLCGTAELASRWADDLLGIVRRVQQERKAGTFAWFTGTGACYSALFKAGRHDELLELLHDDPPPIWPYLMWGGRVLLARGAVDEAIDYLRSRGGINTPPEALARFAEEAFLQAGRRAEAFERYAIAANQANSRLSTYRAIAKKYPEIDPERLLRELIASTPGEEGKWFATAKSLKRFDLAIKLAWASPSDPKTLTRAARDHLEDRPAFAVQAAMAAMRWMAAGYGYELTGAHAREALRLATDAAQRIGQEQEVRQWIQQLLACDDGSARWLRLALGLPSSP